MEVRGAPILQRITVKFNEEETKSTCEEFLSTLSEDELAEFNAEHEILVQQELELKSKENQSQLVGPNLPSTK